MAVDLSRLTRFHRHFNGVQKAVILGIISVFMAVVLGNVVVFTTFMISLLTTIFFLRRAIRCRTLLRSQYLLSVVDSIEAFYVAVYEFIYGHIPAYIAAKKLIVSGDIESEIKYYRQFIMRDFVESWYEFISNEDECRAEIREFLEEVTLSAMERASYVDVHDFADKAIRLVQKHLKDYQTAKTEWEMQPFYKRKSGLRKEFKKQETLIHMFESQGKFHVALKDEKTCVLYIRAIMDIVMKILVPSKVYSCYAAKELLLEMLSNNLLEQIFSMMSDTYWLHETLIQITSDEELVVKLNQVVKLEESSPLNDGNGQPEMTSACTLDSVPHVEDANNTNINELMSLEEPEESQNLENFNPAKRFSCQSFISHISVDDTPQNSTSRRATVPSVLPVGLLASSESSHVSNNSHRGTGIDINIDFENVVIGASASMRSVTPPPGAGTEERSGSNLHPNSNPHLLLRRNFSESAISQNETCILEEDEDELESDGPRPMSTFFFLPSEDEVSLASSDISLDEVPDQRSVPDGKEDGQDQGSLSNDNSLQHRNSDTPTPPIINQNRRVSDSCFNYQILPEKIRKVSHFSNSVDEETLEVTMSGQHVYVPLSSTTPLEASVDTSHDCTPTTSVDEKAQDAFYELQGAIHESPLTLVMEIYITDTEKMREPYNKNYYTLYVIEYIAWHRHENAKSWVLKQDHVKRRFREFVTLQERLEEKKIYQRSLQGVKSPQRWKFVPVNHLQEKNINLRKNFLENYLQELIARPAISNSMAMREFLAYEGDTRLAFVKKAPEMPRIDKVITKTFSNVLHRVSSTVRLTKDEETLEQKVEGGKEGRQKSKDKDREPELDRVWVDMHALQIDPIVAEKENCSKVELHLSLCSHNVPEVDEDSSDDLDGPQAGADAAGHGSWGKPLLSRECSLFQDPGEEEYRTSLPLGRAVADGCDFTDEQRELLGLDKDVPLAAAVLDVGLQTLGKRAHWVCQQHSLHVIKVLISRALDSWLKTEILDLVSEKRWTYHLQLLREVLWPGGILDTNPRQPPSDTQKEAIKQQARQCLKTFLPFYIPLLVGQDQFNLCIEEVFDCIEYTKLNRHLALCLFDLAIETLFPEIRTIDFYESFSNLARRQRCDSSFYGSSA